MADAPELEDVADDILEWIEDAPIVGHNVRVELDVLTRSLEGWAPPAAYDTLKLARLLLPQTEKHGLEALGKLLQLDLKAEAVTGSLAHSALYDATLSAMLLRTLLEPLASEERSRLLALCDVVRPQQAQLL